MKRHVPHVLGAGPHINHESVDSLASKTRLPAEGLLQKEADHVKYASLALAAYTKSCTVVHKFIAGQGRKSCRQCPLQSVRCAVSTAGKHAPYKCHAILTWSI